MKNYTYLQNTWKDKLIRHADPYTSLKHTNISKENKHLLEYLGLPILSSKERGRLLPFTFYHVVIVDDKEFYLLGDISNNVIGKTFLGLEKETEEIYQVHQSAKDGLYYKWMNTSLYQYLMCLAYYINFMNTEYPYPTIESKTQVQKDYQKLLKDMTKVDTYAMDRTNFWGDIIYCIQISEHGDYFSDFNYEISEPPSPEEQKRIDNMDLPF